MMADKISTDKKSLRLDDYPKHILQAIIEIQDYVAGMSFADFQNDRKTQRALVMCFVIIGEASTKVMQKYPDFVNGNTHIAWQSMRGMRNQLAHGYFSINLKIVWNTIEKALPTLKNQLENINYD